MAKILSKVISGGKKLLSIVGVERILGWVYSAYMKWFKSKTNLMDKLLGVTSLLVQVGVVLGYFPAAAATASIIQLVAYNLGDFLDDGKINKSYKSK